MPTRRLNPCKRRRCLLLSNLNVEIMHSNGSLRAGLLAHFSCFQQQETGKKADSQRQWSDFVSEIHMIGRLSGWKQELCTKDGINRPCALEKMDQNT